MAQTDISDRIAAIDPDRINWSDPNAFAAMGIGEPDDESGTDANEGDTQAADSAQAAAATPASAAPAPAASPTAAPATSSATPAAAQATAPAEPERPHGVATRDGKHIIPYEVLEAARAAARNAERERDELRQRLEQAAEAPGRSGAAASEELQERAAQGLLTEEERTDFPGLAKLERAFSALNERLDRAAAAPAAAPAAQAPADPAASQLSDQEQYDSAIAQAPLLKEWMASKGEQWQRAVALDQVIQKQNPNLSYAERFARVQRAVAAEFGQAMPTASPSPAPAPAPAARQATAPAVREAALPSLSDMGGSAPQQDEDLVNASTSTDLLARAEKMTDAELMRLAGL